MTEVNVVISRGFAALLANLAIRGRVLPARGPMLRAQCDMSTGTVMCWSKPRVTPPSTSSRMRECP